MEFGFYCFCASVGQRVFVTPRTSFDWARWHLARDDGHNRTRRRDENDRSVACHFVNRQAWQQAATGRSGGTSSTSRRSVRRSTAGRRPSRNVSTTASRRLAASPSTSRWTTSLPAAGRTSTPVAWSTRTRSTCPEPTSTGWSTDAPTQPLVSTRLFKKYLSRSDTVDFIMKKHVQCSAASS